MPDGRRWKLSYSFSYRVGNKKSRDKLVVWRGFVTDFASVPRCLWWVVPQWGKWGKAAVLHDFLYQTKLRSRREADGIFLEAMGVLGVKNWRKYPMFLAVRCFGFLAW
tara:strand:+ start:1812 stop:2135 length:324 start_codon:yes stop_codon:yes gene_type:complete